MSTSPAPIPNHQQRTTHGPLREVDGNAALVQPVYVEAERRAVDIPRDCMVEWELGRTVRRAEAVAAKVEE